MLSYHFWMNSLCLYFVYMSYISLPCSTGSFSQLDADIKEDFLVRIGDVFGVDRAEALQLYSLILQCMDHRESVSQTVCICVLWL